MCVCCIMGTLTQQFDYDKYSFVKRLRVKLSTWVALWVIQSRPGVSVFGYNSELVCPCVSLLNDLS